MKELTLKNQEELIQTFLDLQDISETSKLHYRQSVKRYFTWCDNHGLNVLNANKIDVLKYKQSMIEEKLSTYSICLYLTAVRLFYQCAEDNNTGAYRSPARGIKGVKKGTGFKKDALTVDQVKDLLDNASSKRDRALLLLMVTTGLRTIEVSRTDIEDIKNIGNSTVLMIQGKGQLSKDQFVILERPVEKELRLYLQERRKRKGPLFVNQMKNGNVKRLHPGSISRIVKDSLRGIGLDNGMLTAHSLRHTTATLAYLAGAPVEEIQQLMRHRSINTTMIYTHTLDKLKSRTSRKILDYMYAKV